MKSKWWIKLWIEMLDDPKYARLEDRHWRRGIELMMIAGDEDEQGVLPDIDQICWRLRLSEAELQADLDLFIENGFLFENADGFYVITNFADRQSAMSSTERSKRARTSKRKDKDYYRRDYKLPDDYDN